VLVCDGGNQQFLIKTSKTVAKTLHVTFAPQLVQPLHIIKLIRFYFYYKPFSSFTVKKLIFHCLSIFFTTVNICQYLSPGWPRMCWLSTDSMTKLPKDWQPPPKTSEDVPCYVEVKEIPNKSDTVTMNN